MPPKPQGFPIYERLKKVKAVTIALGFNCVDGVVLCADRQMTATGWHKYNESKMYAISGFGEQPTYTVMLTYAGSPHVMKAMHQKIADTATDDTHFVSIGSLKGLLEGCLSEMTREDVETTNFLCGFCRKGGTLGLLRTNGYQVYEVGGYDCIGVGDSSLLRFLSKLLVSSPMRAWPAVAVGDYMVKQAKEFIDGCGGPTDIYILRGDGKCAPPSSGWTEKKSEISEAIEHDVRGLIWMMMNDGPQNKIEDFWNALRIRVRDFFPLDS